MAVERKWLTVAPRQLTSNGTQNGEVYLASTSGFKVKQIVTLQSVTKPPLSVQVKRVVSSTLLLVGPVPTKQGEQSLTARANISAYTTVDNAFIYAAEQDKSMLKPDDIEQATYEQEPTVAKRSIQVDEFGNFYNKDNPIPVTFSGSINVNVLPSGTIQNIYSVYNEVTSVPSYVSTTISSYTVLPGQTASLHRVIASGENIARYDILVNSIPVATKRTYFGSPLDIEFLFGDDIVSGLMLNPGDVIEVKTIHSRVNSATFDATIEMIINPIIVVGQTFVVDYNETLIIGSSNATVLTYTVPIGKTASLQRILFSGENVAKYDVLHNTTKIATKRTYFGGGLDGIFEFTGISGGGVALNSGDTVNIIAYNNRSSSARFDCTIESMEFI